MKRKLMGVIVMTLSGIFSSLSPGLRYESTSLVPYGDHHVYGSVQLSLLPDRTQIAQTSGSSSGARVSLLLHGLTTDRSYQALIGYGSADGAGNMDARIIGEWKAHAGTERETFTVPGIRGLPELGWSVIVRSAPVRSAQGGESGQVALPRAAIVSAGALRQSYSYAPIVKTAVLGPYLVVLSVGPPLRMVTPAQAHKGIQGDEYAAAAPGHTGYRLHATYAKHRVNLRIRLHVFSLATGLIVTDLQPQVNLFGQIDCRGAALSDLATVYSDSVGMPDFQYDSNVYLPVGLYRATVIIGKRHVTLSDFQVTPNTYLAVNPMTLPPAATVREENGSFVPSQVHVKSGDKVLFVYDGIGADQIFVDGIKSPMLLTGQSWTYTTNLPGVYEVRLVYARSVRMKLFVKSR